MRKAGCCLLGLVLCLLFTGCSGSVNLQERLIVQSLAIDFEKGYRVTAQVYRPENQMGSLLVSAEGETLSKALEGLQKVSGRTPFYSELSAVVVGSSAVRQGLEELLLGLGRENGIRKGVYLFYTDQKSSDWLSSESVSDEDWIHLAQSQLSPPIMEQARLYRVAGRIHQEGQDGFLPLLYRDSSDPESGFRIDRVVCLKGEELSLTLDAEQTETLGWILGGISMENRVMETSYGRVVLKPQAAGESLSYSPNQNEGSLRLKQILSCDFLDASPSEKEGRIYREEIADQWKTQMHRRVENLIQTVFLDAKIDIFSFGLHAGAKPNQSPTVTISLKITKD